jgi:Protein of unknown function (DUF3522)
VYLCKRARSLALVGHRMDFQREEWNGNELHGLFLVASNVAIFPAMYLASRRGHMSTVVIFLWTFLGSVSYHSCRAWMELCDTKFRLAMITDYIFVYNAIVWIITKLGLRQHNFVFWELHIFLYTLLMGPIIFAILFEVRSSWLPIVGIALPLFSVIVVSLKTGNRLVYNKPWATATIVLIILAGLFMFCLSDTSYYWAHTLWHLCAMFAAWTEEIAAEPSSADSAQHRIEYEALCAMVGAKTHDKQVAHKYDQLFAIAGLPLGVREMLTGTKERKRQSSSSSSTSGKHRSRRKPQNI